MKPNFVIKQECTKDDIRYVWLDTQKSTLLGIPWRALGDFGKRKAENLFFLESMDKSKQRLEIMYV